MPNRVQVIVIPKDTESNIDFGTLFHHAISYFRSIGAYSAKNHLGESVLMDNINMNFCRIVQGTMYGHFPIYLPDGDGSIPLGAEARNPFFHFSTLKEENWHESNQQFSIALDDDQQARNVLYALYKVYSDKGYKVKLES